MLKINSILTPLGFRNFVVALFVIVISAYMGYRFWTTRDIAWRWEEEVQLADGGRIMVKRKQETEMKGGGEPFTNPRGPKSGRITIMDGSNDVEWESALFPMIVERGLKPGQWVIIASPIFCQDHYKYGSPKPPYIQFEYTNGHWVNRHVDPKWYGRRSNLLMAYEKFEMFDGKSITAEEIRKFNNPVYKVPQRYLFVDAKRKSNCYR